MRKFVVGDLHGNYLGLMQCLEKVKFNKEEDLLISLGDICDGYNQVYEIVEELLSFKHFILIRGNHDEPFMEFMKTGLHPWNWQQGGEGTRDSYYKSTEKAYNQPLVVPESHKDFFNKSLLYYVDEDKNLFVHGGFNRHYPIEGQPDLVYTWDRDFWASALSFAASQRSSDSFLKFKTKDKFKNIFLGYTPTLNWDRLTPMQAGNVYNIDTGAGFTGSVTIMNIDTLLSVQSEVARVLYPTYKGRRKTL